MLKTLAGAAALTLTALPTLAANIYGQNGDLVGPAVGPGVALALPKSAPGVTAAQFIQVAFNRPVWTSSLYFQSEDCTGARFIPYDPNVDLLPTAQFDGQSFWGGIISQAGIYKMQSKFVAVLPDGFECQVIPRGQRQIRAAPTFQFGIGATPPFRIVP